MAFQDHFSGHAKVYREFRPRYPAELFAALADLAPGRQRAWDVGTGSGQAALGLAQHFEEVLATDASAAQIEQSESHPRVRYRVLPAENTDFSDAAFDLVLVAQAAHWFDLPRFYTEALRVLRPRGVLVLMAYGLHLVSAEIDTVIRSFYDNVIGPYWPPERRHVESAYETIGFPLPRLTLPSFAMEESWDLAALLGYVRSWSATQRYQAAHRADPVNALEPVLSELWGDRSARRTVRWPLTVLAGRRAG